MVKMNKIKSGCNSMADSVASAAEEDFFESWFVIKNVENSHQSLLASTTSVIPK
jgi:hypothetical protein